MLLPTSSRSYDELTVKEYSVTLPPSRRQADVTRGDAADTKTAVTHNLPASTSKTKLTTLLRKADPGIFHVFA